MKLLYQCEIEYLFLWYLQAEKITVAEFISQMAQNLNSSSDEMATQNLQTFLEVSILSCLDIPTILSHVADRLILS